MTPQQMTIYSYKKRVNFDTDMCKADPRHAQIGIDDILADRMKAAASGTASDKELENLVGRHIQFFRRRGNLAAAPGSMELHEIAQVLAASEYEAMARAAERTDGVWNGTPALQVLIDADLTKDVLHPQDQSRETPSPRDCSSSAFEHRR